MRTHLFTAAALLALIGMLSFNATNTARADHHEGEAQTATATPEAPANTAPEGFTRLFDGESLVGWTPLSGKASYRVEDGTIVGTTVAGSPNSFLCTTRTYSNFELTFDVLLVDNQLNSGCQIRSKIVNDQGGRYGGRIGGPQVEIEAGNNSQSGLVYGEASGGWQSPNPNDRAHAHFHNGQWNNYRIVAQGSHIQTFINGTPIEDFNLSDEYNSQFTEGVIGLQVHQVGGDPSWSVRWRNIYIRELEAE